MKAFLTGGTGFVGNRLLRLLVEQGHAVTALVRSEAGATQVTALGAQPVTADLTDPASLGPAMAGADVVFHLAARYELGALDTPEVERINVEGTRAVLSTAHALGVERIVYVSTLAVFGDTQGRLVDEDYFAAGPFLTDYDRTKWRAHYEVALPLIEQEAPIIIAMPGVVFGPGDHSLIGDLMRAFLHRELPFIPGPTTMFTFVHVDDLAVALLLLGVKGRVGETYITAGPPVPLGDMIAFWSHLTGVRPPLLSIPAPLLRASAPLIRAVEKYLPLPAMYSGDAVALMGATYIGRADKMQAELGWHPRPLQAGMLDTFGWLASTTSRPPYPLTAEQRLLVVAVVVSLLGLLLARGLKRKR